MTRVDVRRLGLLGRLALLGLIAVVGVAAGFAVAAVTAGAEPSRISPAVPVPASPSVPAPAEPTEAPTEPYAPDIDYPTLVPPTRFARREIGNDLQTWSYLVPHGWTAYDVITDAPVPVEEVASKQEIRFRPADEPTEGGFSLRVKTVDEHVDAARMLELRLGALEDLDDVTVLERTEDSLYFTYRTDEVGRLRYNFFRWFTAPGAAEATLEMSVAGRERDEIGMRGLFEQFAGGLEPVD